MYGKDFCKIYNELGWNYYSETFGEQLKIWLKNMGVNPVSFLDIGCGTGVLCRIMRDMGLKIKGIDLSKNMIEIAKKNCPGANFVVADMVTYQPEEKVDLVTCTCDALNHLSDISLVDTMIHNVFNYITPGGYFIFDILNGQEGHDETPFELAKDGDRRILLQITKNRQITTLHVYTYEGENLLHEEKVVETFYEPSLISDILLSAGFDNITCNDSLNPTHPGHGTALFFTAQKPL
ncbi:Methyltransferase domain-containing protein [Acetitomaculum ruminis DSM 5522]|uniref:Methyltransferase domain-containing protein n=1 Tax=Acetitomaculum ruminis DSM 5522 TaxID=1120918 RepID=A0A1I0Y2S7_9FIRM|nr:class I SAM-dependent methyltransferase [Acetitomaculum ruminis]SFB07625.1 Methyltransferase domain-containing protein [Acetitomaculum ruminis DSM 5522]